MGVNPKASREGQTKISLQGVTSVRISWIMPEAEYAGGTRVIAIHCEQLMVRGHEVVVISTPMQPWSLRRRMGQTFGHRAQSSPAGAQRNPQLATARIWPTQEARRTPETKRHGLPILPRERRTQIHLCEL